MGVCGVPVLVFGFWEGITVYVPVPVSVPMSVSWFWDVPVVSNGDGVVVVAAWGTLVVIGPGTVVRVTLSPSSGLLFGVLVPGIGVAGVEGPGNGVGGVVGLPVFVSEGVGESNVVVSSAGVLAVVSVRANWQPHWGVRGRCWTLAPCSAPPKSRTETARRMAQEPRWSTAPRLGKGTDLATVSPTG